MIRVIERIYWKIYYWLKSHYFKRKYSKLPPKIYYDRKHNVYINPKLIDERGFAEYVCGESARSGVFYDYEIEGNSTHAHAISEVFLDAYNYSETFAISEGYRE
jgi:hypothetical protein